MDLTAKKVIAAYLLRRRKRRARHYWVHPVVAAWQKHGEYHRLVTELRLHPDLFQQNFRLSRELFDELLARVGPRIAKTNTQFRKAIGPAQHLAICLRVVREVAATIWDVLLPDYMPAPSTEDWRAIADRFSQRWNFPNCVGSVDGKHVVIQAPDSSLYFNYKGTYSIVLLAVVDAVTVVDVGGYGRTSDGGSLYASAFGEGLRDGTFLRMPSYQGLNIRTPELHHQTGDTGDCLQHCSRMAANNATQEALRVRARFASYFSEEGAVPWQVRP
ncbi:hypothetical protein ACEWY4_010190 [Coilia grayii]|uniref:DDE Tnp4 domain-containing protein n=1 Tax=Coilia grayii TaxID=363190 RepID=A0ABD1K8K9_9TELE